MPLISIIIPTCNSEANIRNCLLSLLNQVFDDFEIIIQDCLSSDKTIVEIDAVRNLFPKAKIYITSQSDKGIYDAMNKALRQARGVWLYFLGSDDMLYDPTTLQKIFTDKENLEVDILYGNVYSTRFNGKYDGEFSAQKLLNQNICHQAIFVKKKVFDSIGVFNLKFKAHADWDHNIRWFFCDKLKHKYIDEIVSIYSDGGFSSVSTDKTFLVNKEWLFLRQSYRQIDKELRKEVLNRLIHTESTPVISKYLYKFLYHLNSI